MTPARRSWAKALVPLPVLAVTTVFCVDTLAGGRLLWPPTRVSLADAIVLRNAGEATRQLLGGADPNVPSLLAEGSPNRRPRRMLPADAAVRSGEARLLDLLARHGARFDAPLLVRLYCDADRMGEDEIRRWVEARLGGPADCDQ